jgi:hypothetical protein
MRETAAGSGAYILVDDTTSANATTARKERSQMYAKQMLAAVGLYVATAMLAAATSAGPPWFEARTAGAETLTLRGAAEFGRVDDRATTGRYVVTLGPESATGTLVLTWPDGHQPAPGVYPVSDAGPSAVRALIVTGSPGKPGGAYRGKSGTLTIAKASADAIQGQFVFEADGFTAMDPANEGRRLDVQGSFVARSGH